MTIRDKLKLAANGTLLMVVLIPVPTKVIGHRTGTQSITTRLDTRADDGGQSPLPAARLIHYSPSTCRLCSSRISSGTR
jgi:hypothetical protein